MEENITELIESFHSGESKKFKGIDDLVLTWKYLPVLTPGLSPYISIFYRQLKLRDSSSSKGSLCIVHGLGEHSGKYIHAAVYFALKGFEVHIADLRSYGNSTGIHAGHSLIDFQSDTNLLLMQARNDIPCFLWGHSMGGAVVTSLCINNPKLKLAGVILTGPAFQVTGLPYSFFKASWMRIQKKIFSENLFNFYFPNGVLSKDKEYLIKLAKDHKVSTLAGYDLLLSLSDTIQLLKESFFRFKHPVIFFHGSQDVLTKIEGSKEAYEKCGSLDKTFRKLEGVYHEPQNDVERDQFFGEVLEWMLNRLGSDSLDNTSELKIGLPEFFSAKKFIKYFVGFSIIAIAAATTYRIRNLKSR